MDVLTRIDDLVRREHRATVELIEALVLCDRLRAHLDAGYSSLFDLLTRRLRYSNAAAARRLGAVRCAQRCPRALELLRARRTSLTVLAKIESALATADDPDALLASIDGRSQPEVERLLATRRPVDRPRERVRTIAVKPTPDPTPDPAPTRVPTRSAAEVIAPKDRVPTSTADCTGRPTREPATQPDPRVALSFSVAADDFHAFERARTELAKNLPRSMSLEETFNALVQSFLKRHRVERPRAANATAQRTRHIPRALRRQVLARDGHRCTFVAPDGTRCGSTRALEIDHVVPFAHGGAHALDNLRVLCRAHNRRAAELVFGPRA